jgi:dienelactone hydrolase
MKNIFQFCIFLAIVSCTTDPAAKQRVYFSKNTPENKVISNICCKSDMQQGYSIFLPAGYNPEKKYPVIFCFDPHGDGTLPLNLLKEEATETGFVLVGSNNIKNGLSQDIIFQYADILINDVKYKINVDENRIYTAGFSGGARVALSLVTKYNQIRGVIACSAGIPVNYIPQNTLIAGIAGYTDMNYSEVEEMDNSFPVNSDKHIFLTFNGVHGWPSKFYLQTALDWMLINEMKAGTYPKNEKIINRFILSQSNDSLNIIDKHRGYNQIIRTLNGFTDIDNYKVKISEIEKNTDFIKATEQKQNIAIAEKDQQKILIDAFNSKDINWWRTELKKLTSIQNSSQDEMVNALNKRLLAYVSLYSFSACNYAKNASDKAAFSKFLEIYGCADPLNPDYLYYQAYYYALNNQKDLSLKALAAAIKNGFTAFNKVVEDPIFTGIADNEILQKMKNGQ